MKTVAIKLILFLLIFQTGISSLAQRKQIAVGNEGQNTIPPVHNRYAFVLGIDHYEDPQISSLASCRLDAVRFSAFLKSNAGWRLPKERIQLLLDSRKDEITKSFTELLDQVTDVETSTLYFYFSGHGIKGSIVPSNYQKGYPETLISYAWIKREIEKRNIRASVFIVDACYSGSIIDTKDTGFDSSFAQAINEDNSQMVVFTATNAYRVTAAGKHESMYSKHFLEAIENPRADTNGDMILSSGELFEEIKRKVGVSNTPQFAGSTDFPMANFRPRSLSFRNDPSASDRNYKPERAVDPLYSTNSLVQWREDVETKSIDGRNAQQIVSELKASNSAECRAKLGFLYREGIGVEKNINKALSYFIPSAAEGNSFAEYNLGYLYSNGIGMNADPEKAIEYYTRAAEKGDPFAQNNFGIEYSKKKDGYFGYNREKSIFWFEKAANQGNSRSQLALAALFRDKAKWTVDTVKKQQYFEKAFHWLKRASECGNARAQYELARAYEFGLGAPRDTDRARYWYKKACEKGRLRGCRKVLLLDQP